MSKQTYYFSHDYNARSDEKIKKLIKRHGMEGYGIFWSIIEDLYNNDNDFPADFDDIAYDLREDRNIIRSIICDFDLFILENGRFGSISVQRRLEDMAEKSEKARQKAFKRWRSDAETNTNASENNATASENNATASKSDAIKDIKEIKERNKGKRSSFMPPSLEEVKEYFKFRGYTEESAVKAWNHYDLADWHDTSGKPVLNWKQKMNTVWLKPENKIVEHKLMMP